VRGGQEQAGDGEKRVAVLALMEASREEQRRADEGQLRCGMLRGWRCPFIGVGRGVQAGSKGNVMTEVIAVVVNGD
jgi:hypothetical protein